MFSPIRDGEDAVASDGIGVERHAALGLLLLDEPDIDVAYRVEDERDGRFRGSRRQRRLRNRAPGAPFDAGRQGVGRHGKAIESEGPERPGLAASGREGGHVRSPAPPVHGSLEPDHSTPDRGRPGWVVVQGA